MASYLDFTDFQIVISADSPYEYDPRPKGSFSDFTDFQPQLSPNMTVNRSLKQYGNFFLMYEESAGVWEGPHDIDINPNSDAEITAVIGATSELTPQELFDLADGSADVTLVFAEDIGVSVAVADEETNIAKVLINTVSGVKTVWLFDNLS